MHHVIGILGYTIPSVQHCVHEQSDKVKAPRRVNINISYFQKLGIQKRVVTNAVWVFNLVMQI